MNEPDGHLSQRHRKAARGSIRVYRRLLVAYPEDFRKEYTEEMVRYFGELCEDSLRRGGLPTLLITWLRTLWELARSSRAERRGTVPDIDINAPSATALSLLVFPGTGQVYNRQSVKGATHALLFLVTFSGAGLWLFGSKALGVTLVCIWVYSAVDALLSARRIKALQRATR